MKKKLLALDGGGVLGVGQACVLAQADTDKFDYLAGTSVGSVLAGIIGSGGDRSMMTNFFYEYAPSIFAGRWWRRMNIFSTPRYDDKELKKLRQAGADRSAIIDDLADLWVSLTSLQDK